MVLTYEEKVKQWVNDDSNKIALFRMANQLKLYSQSKYPERPWSYEFYCNVAHAWVGKEEELKERLELHRKEMPDVPWLE